MVNAIRFDWAIKRMLRSNANFSILEGFLSELLCADITIESILENGTNKVSIDNNMNHLVVLVNNSKDESIIIEIQSNYSYDFMRRVLSSPSKLVVDNMAEGMLYSKIKKIISVNIVYFNLGHGDDYVYHGFTSFFGIHNNDKLSLSDQEKKIFNADHIERIYPEYYILKINKFDNVSRNTLDEWINFLKNEEVKEGSTAKGLLEAKKELDKLKLSKEAMREYEADLANWRDNQSLMSTKYLEGELAGIDKGIKMGEQAKEKYADEKVKLEKIEIARSMLEDGMSIPKIAKLTGLSEEEIGGMG